MRAPDAGPDRAAGARREAPAGERAEPVPGVPGPDGGEERLVALFTGGARRGRRRIGPRTSAFSLFGTVEIDLTEAFFTQRLTTVDVVSVFGTVEVRVPENVSLRGGGTGVFGSFRVDAAEAADPEAPVVVVNGCSVFGGVEARPERGRRVADLLHGRTRGHSGR